MSCELHSVYVTDRGGAQRLFTLNDIESVRYTRTLDDISVGEVVISGEACREQAELLGQVEPRRHELVIYRGDDRVWEGPIVSAEWGNDYVRFSARDVLEYLDARPITQYWPGPENGGPELMGDRIEQIIRYEMAWTYIAPGLSPQFVRPWDSGGYGSITPAIDVLAHLEVRPGTVITRTETYPFEMTVYEHLSTLARGGLDYTTIGRKILIWDSRETIGQTRTMTTKDFAGNLKVYGSGQDLVGVQHVVASRDTDDGELPPTSTANVGSALRDTSYYGPWAKIHSREEEDTAVSREALNTQALRLSAGRIPLPTEIVVDGGARILLDDTLTIHSLVAGVDVPIVAVLAGRTMNQVQRFRHIGISETSSGEEITASLNPGRGE